MTEVTLHGAPFDGRVAERVIRGRLETDKDVGSPAGAEEFAGVALDSIEAFYRGVGNSGGFRAALFAAERPDGWGPGDFEFLDSSSMGRPGVWLEGVIKDPSAIAVDFYVQMSRRAAELGARCVVHCLATWVMAAPGNRLHICTNREIVEGKPAVCAFLEHERLPSRAWVAYISLKTGRDLGKWAEVDVVDFSPEIGIILHSGDVPLGDQGPDAE